MSVLNTAVTAGMPLVGVALTAFATYRTQAAQHRAKARHELVTTALNATADLTTAIDAHRAAMWRSENLRLTGAELARADEARINTHHTRAGISNPQVRLSVLLPALTAPAEMAVQATFEMRNSPDLATLQTRRAAALAARWALVKAAQQAFEGHGVSLPDPNANRGQDTAATPAVPATRS